MEQNIRGIGCFITAILWMFAGFVLFMIMVGDCAPSTAHGCPTEADRKLQLLMVALSALGLNLALIWLMRLPGRDGK